MKDEVRLGCWFAGLRVQMGERRRRRGRGGLVFGVSKEDYKFVEGLKEAQPYNSAYRGSTFVVVFQAEIVTNQCLDNILLYCPSLSLFGSL